jgi:3-oxoadipate enol-lactonase
MPFADVGPARVEYLVEGQGPGLVLIHGTSGSATTNWDHLVGRFAAESTVVRPNYAGSGATTDPGGRLQLDDLVAQVLGAATEAGLERFDVVGFSLGAVVALALAAGESERVRSVTAINGWSSSADGRTQLQFRLWQELHARDHRLLAEVLMLTAFSQPFLSRLSWAEVEAMVVEMTLTVPSGIPRQADLDLRVDLDDAVAAIAVPALVIGSTRDHMVPVEHSHGLRDRIPGARYVELDTGHVVIFEAPDALAEAIETFLREVRTGEELGVPPTFQPALTPISRQVRLRGRPQVS